MKKLILLLILAFVMWLYGWRFYPQAMMDYPPFKFSKTYKRPIAKQVAKKNVMAKWNPSAMLDGVSGERQRVFEDQMRQNRQQSAKATASVKKSSLS